MELSGSFQGLGIKHVAAMPTIDIENQILQNKDMHRLDQTDSIVNIDDHKMGKDRKTEAKRHTELLKQVKATKNKPQGLLAIHIKRAWFVSLNPDKMYNNDHLSVYVRILTGRQMKCSCVYDKVVAPTEIIFDDLKHFLIQPSPERHDQNNVVRIEVVVFDEKIPLKHRLLASKEIHMYDIIKNLYMVETFDMRRIQTVVAEIDVELCFSYGTFGYGCSNQFENRKVTYKNQLSHSMYYRPAAPEGRMDSGRREVMTCRHVGHPSFIDFSTKVEIGTAAHEFADDISEHAWLLNDEKTLFVNKIRKHMKILQKEYQQQKGRRERVAFLQQLILSDVTTICPDNVDLINVPKGFRFRRRAHRPTNAFQAFGDHDAVEEDATDSAAVASENLDESQMTILQIAPGITGTRRTKEQGTADSIYVAPGISKYRGENEGRKTSGQQIAVQSEEAGKGGSPPSPRANVSPIKTVLLGKMRMAGLTRDTQVAPAEQDTLGTELGTKKDIKTQPLPTVAATLPGVTEEEDEDTVSELPAIPPVSLKQGRRFSLMPLISHAFRKKSIPGGGKILPQTNSVLSTGEMQPPKRRASLLPRRKSHEAVVIPRVTLTPYTPNTSEEESDESDPEI